MMSDVSYFFVSVAMFFVGFHFTFWAVRRVIRMSDYCYEADDMFSECIECGAYCDEDIACDFCYDLLAEESLIDEATLFGFDSDLLLKSGWSQGAVDALRTHKEFMGQ